VQAVCPYTANFFKINPVVGQFYKHRVDFEPAKCGRGLKVAALHQHPQLHNSDYLLTGEIIIFTKQLEATEWEFTTKKDNKLRVRLQAGIPIDMKSPSSLFEVLTLNNLVVRRLISLLPGYTQVGRHLINFNEKRVVSLDRSVSVGLVRGTEIHSLFCHGGPMLQVDLFFRSIATTNMADMLRGRQVNEAEIAQMGVCTSYNNMIYRINNVEHGMTPADTFETKSGKISYHEYLKQRYRIEVRDLRQPMLSASYRVRAPGGGGWQTRNVYLVPELCNLIGLTPRQKRDFRVRRAMLAATSSPPDQRKQDLSQLVERLGKVSPALCPNGHALKAVNPANSPPCTVCNKAPSEYACNSKRPCPASLCQNCARARVAFNVALEKQPVNLKASTLSQETILSGNPQNPAKTLASRGHFDEVAHNPQFEKREVRKAFVICYQDHSEPTKRFYSTMRAHAAQCGITWPEIPQVLTPPPSVPMSDVVARLRSEFTTALKESGFVLTILRDNGPEAYGLIKQLLVAEMGVVSQCLTFDKIGKSERDRTIATKCSTQIICKLGVTPWLTPFEGMPPDLIVVGIDSVRKRGTRGCITTFVSSACQHTLFYSQVLHGENSGDNLGQMMKNALQHHRKHLDGKLPSCIVIYRNGISDGEIQRIEKFELSPMAMAAQGILQPGEACPRWS
jgi:hypothetical protein